MKRNSKLDTTAVANFLASMSDLSAPDAFANLRADAKSYGWSASTVDAIAKAISARFARKP